jgi:bifunctional non-homologous end joining protein LigD
MGSRAGSKAKRGTLSPLALSPGSGLSRPAIFLPQLATQSREAPAGDDWLHEIKLDGYRIGCDVDQGAVRLLSRQGNDWTSRFPEIGAAAATLGVTTALFDGEVCVVLADGRTSFHALQRALTGGSRAGLVYFLFDILHLDGEDLGRLPIEERKSRLSGLMKNVPKDLPLRTADHVLGNGPAVFAAAGKLGLEGIVSKRRGQPYRPGRSSGWLKTKCSFRQELVIGGFTHRGAARSGPSPGAGQGIGALLCGYYANDGRLVFAGKVGSGFSERGAADLSRRLEALRDANCPFNPQPDPLSRRGAQWVRPTLVGEVAFGGWTDDVKIRHSTFLGLRADKSATDVRLEMTPKSPDA